jgi:hypothetical protein
MIATCLAARKTVLFVAEKTAALDVVHRRLREHGLDDHCLELHSSKADRKQFFAQLKRSWESRANTGAPQWVKLNARLQMRRDELNAYVAALHRQAPNGLTPYIAMGIATSHHEDHAPSLAWSRLDQHDAADYADLEHLASRLGMTYAAVQVRPVLRLVHVEEWTGAWQERLLGAARALSQAAAAAKTALAAVSGRFGLPGTDDSRLDGLGYFADLARDIGATSGSDHTIILHKDFAALGRAVADLATAIRSYRESEARLSVACPPDVVMRIPVDELDRDWREAGAAMWPKSWLGKRRIGRLLGSYINARNANPATDLVVLRQMQSTYSAIHRNPVATAPLKFEGLDTDCQSLSRHLQIAERLRTSLVQLGEFAGDVEAVAASIAPGL